VDPGGGADSVGYAATNVGTGPFRLAPRVGDRLAISIYYDQRGHIFFTVTDLTRPGTQTVMLYVGRLIYPAARLWVQTDRVLSVVPPAADTRLWQFTGSRLTTYRGDHGTITGPWTTSKMITTTTGTASGTVIVSPSRLSGHGQNFAAWLRRPSRSAEAPNAFFRKTLPHNRLRSSPRLTLASFAGHWRIRTRPGPYDTTCHQAASRACFGPAAASATCRPLKPFSRG